MSLVHHSQHLPSSFSYHANDQLQGRCCAFNYSSSLSEIELSNVSMFTAGLLPNESDYKFNLREISPHSICMLEHILKSQTLIPHNWDEVSRIYFPGTICRNSQGGLAVFYLQHSPIRYFNARPSWEKGWHCVIPQIVWDANKYRVAHN